MLITKLPAEILIEVFRGVSNSNLSQRGTDEINTIKAIARVNKTWHALAVPILYYEVTAGFTGDSDADLQGISLLKLLEIKTKFYEYIRRLNALFHDADVFEIGTFLLMLERYRNVKILSLRGCVAPIWCASLMDRIRKLDLLELDLGEGCAADFLRHMLADTRHTNLKVLKVDDNVDFDEVDLLPFSSRSNIEQLSVDTDFWNSTSLDILIRWPIRLKAFRYTFGPYSIVSDEDQGPSGTAAIQRLLDVHRGSLEIIELKPWSNEQVDGNVVDLSVYTNLRSLRLHSVNILKASPKDVSSRFPAGLTHLELDVTLNDEPYARIAPLDEDDIAWLREFFVFRAESMVDHSLRSVKINYEFNDSAITHCPLTGYIQDEGWPCRSLDKAASILKAYGIELTYPKPYIDKVAWETMIIYQTIPGWEYYTTKEERMAVIPATREECDDHYESGNYSHDDAGQHCQRMNPLPEEIIEATQLTELDGQNCVKICSYFSTSCMNPHATQRRARLAETKDAEEKRRARNYLRGFNRCHDNEYPECAARLAEERRWQDLRE